MECSILLHDTLEKIVIGDVNNILNHLKKHDERYDIIIIADPPYNIGKDFGVSNDTMFIDDYVSWSMSWINDCLKLLNNNGLLYVYGFAEIIARVAVNYPIEEQHWIAWHYMNKATPASKFWQRSYETILCMWKPGSERPELHIDQIREPYTSFFETMDGKTRKGTLSRYGNKGEETIYNVHENGALPRDVIKIAALSGGAGYSERWFMCKTCDNGIYSPDKQFDHLEHDTLKHPTQKPMKLTERLIKSRIDGYGGKVLIPFAGSGSECVVARNIGAEYFGIELNPEYALFARQWLAETRKNRLFI